MKSLTKKSIVISAVLLSLVSVTSLYAYGAKSCDNKNCDMKKSKMCDKKSNHKNYHKKRHGDNSKFLMGLLNTLDLTKEQQTQIDQFTKEYTVERTKVFEAFSVDGFDKQKYIDAYTNKRTNMVKAQANFIENVYSVLTTEQKKEMKEELNDFYNNKKNKKCRM